jgi:hypothetical protein
VGGSEEFGSPLNDDELADLQAEVESFIAGIEQSLDLDYFCALCEAKLDGPFVRLLNVDMVHQSCFYRHMNWAVVSTIGDEVF